MNKVVTFFEDLRGDGLKKIGQKIRDGIKNNVLVHFKSKDNFLKLVNKFNLSRITDNVNTFLKRLNDTL